MPSRSTHRAVGVAALAALAVFAWSAPADAGPTANVGFTVGPAFRGDERVGIRTVDFHLGLRGDVLFLRKHVLDVGVGPWAFVSTHAFDELAWGGGLTTLLPVTELLPFTLSAGAYGRVGNDPWGVEGGAVGSVGFGARSHNFSAAYDLAAQLLVEGRLGFGPQGERTIVAALQVDAAVFVLPFMFLAGAFRTSRETRPVR